MKGGVFFRLFDDKVTMVEALDFFLQNAEVALLTNSSLYGVILKLTLRPGVQSPLHMLTRASFIDTVAQGKSTQNVDALQTELRDLIVKLVVTKASPGEEAWQTNPEKRTSNLNEFYAEVNTQQELAFKTSSQLDPITPFIAWAQVYSKDQALTLLQNLSSTTHPKTLAIDKLMAYLSSNTDPGQNLGVLFMQSVQDSRTLAKAIQNPIPRMIFGTFTYGNPGTRYTITQERGLYNYARLLFLRAGALGVGHLDFHMGNIVVSPADEKLLYRFDDSQYDPGCSSNPVKGTLVGGQLFGRRKPPKPVVQDLGCRTYTEGRMFLLDWGRCFQVHPMVQELARRLSTMFSSAYVWARDGKPGWKWPVELNGLEIILKDVLYFFRYLTTEVGNRYAGFGLPAPGQYQWVANIDTYDIAVMLQLARNLNFTITSTDKPINLERFFQGEPFPFRESFFRSHMFALTPEIVAGAITPPGTLFQLSTRDRIPSSEAPLPEKEVQPVRIFRETEASGPMIDAWTESAPRQRIFPMPDSARSPFVRLNTLSLDEVVPVVSAPPVSETDETEKTSLQVRKLGPEGSNLVLLTGGKRKTRHAKKARRTTHRKR